VEGPTATKAWQALYASDAAGAARSLNLSGERGCRKEGHACASAMLHVCVPKCDTALQLGVALALCGLEVALLGQRRLANVSTCTSFAA